MKNFCYFNGVLLNNKSSILKLTSEIKKSKICDNRLLMLVDALEKDYIDA